MKKKFCLPLFYVMIFFFIFSSALGSVPIHQWEVYSLSFKSTNKYLNPYSQIGVDGTSDLLQVTFVGTSGEAKDKKITLIGFWNDGTQWRVNFSPAYTGSWKYTSSSRDKSMNGKKGTFEVIPWSEEEKIANPTRRGLIQVKKTGDNAGHYFEYQDGQPFLWIADTWWNWTKKDIHFETFKKLVDDRSEKGFTIGQLFVPGNGWRKENSLLDTTYSILDTKQIDKVEQMIRYANSKGITIWMHAWWGSANLDKEIGKEKIERWWRYLVHRFSAYNVIWVVAGEYNLNNYGGLGLDFWKGLGKMIKQEDPYNRITGIHNTPPFWDGGKDAPQWTTASVLNNETWLDYNQCQVGHGKFANELIPILVMNDYNLKPVKPIVVTEPWYEFKAGDPDAKEIRFGAWSAILSGAAGHSYGGGRIWMADVPESAEPENLAFKEKDITSFDYQGAVSLKYLAGFFKKIKWWDLKPHPELVTEYPQPFCLASPGEEYVIYLRYGGVAKINLGKDNTNKNFLYYWFDTATGNSTDEKTIKGSEFLSFKCPNPQGLSVPENKDWVLYIKSSQLRLNN